MRWFWIDRYTEFVSGSHATALKGVSLAEDHLHDHLVGHPLMPNSLVAEGIAQTGGLLVSEHYGFSELVVLAKMSKATFHGNVRPGETLRYEVRADWIRADSAQVSAAAYVTGQQPEADRLHAEVELLYARLGDDIEQRLGTKLFKPSDLRHWLNLVRVFEVGVKQDGTPLCRDDYPLAETSATA